MRIKRALALAIMMVVGGLGAACGGEDDPVEAGQPGGTPGPAAEPVPTGLPRLVAQVEPSVVTVIVGEGLGSGVVFRDGGLVLTNEHVVGGATRVELALASGDQIPAEVVGADAITDLAVLRAERSDLPPVEFRTELPPPGEVVLAMGSPLGFQNSVTMGIVSGVGREIPGSAEQSRALVDLIQTDAAISPGNSGGALIDTSGRVVGINDAYLPPETGAVSIGFAIPAATAQQVADDLLDDGQVTHPYVGIVPGRVTPEIAQALGVSSDRGVLVQEVVAGGPAAAADLQPGDIIVKFHGEPTDTLEQFFGALRGVQPGQSVELTYLRDGETTQATITVGEIER